MGATTFIVSDPDENLILFAGPQPSELLRFTSRKESGESPA